jgi:hypothetical protein
MQWLYRNASKIALVKKADPLREGFFLMSLPLE